MIQKLKSYLFRGFPNDLDTRRRLSLIYVFIPIPILILIVANILALRDTTGNPFNALLFVYLLIMVAAIPIMRQTKNIRVAENILVFLAVPVQLLRLVLGGEPKIALFLIVPWAVFAFFLVGRKMALFWIGLLVSISTLLAFMGQQGIISVGYTMAELLQIYVFLLITIAILYLYDQRQELFQKIARKEQEKYQGEREQLDITKSEIISIMAHQIRTPINIIAWYTELLEKDEPKLSKEQRRSIAQIRSAANHAENLTKELLFASKADLGTLLGQKESVDLPSTFKEIHTDFIPLIHKKKLTLSQSSGNVTTISADSDLVKLIYRVLLSNAIKYTPSGGKIHVSHTRHKKDVIVEISDTGFGISDKDKKQIFSKLFRSKQAVLSDPEGFGLALYTVKKTVEDAGGRVWFESPAKVTSSKDNPGTTFYVALPIN